VGARIRPVPAPESLGAGCVPGFPSLRLNFHREQARRSAHRHHRRPLWHGGNRGNVAALDQKGEGSAVAGLREEDVERMRAELFFDGPERTKRLSRYWLLLVLAAIIAAAGVVSDSTATVIGAMIVAPLMTPILGIVVAVVLTDMANLRRCLVLLVLGAAAVVGIGVLVGLFVPYPVVAATSSQVAARITPRLVDLVAALATGAVGSVALARSDISDTLPGVAIAISLVPPLAVVGLTLQSGSGGEALGAFLLFATNVAAILGSGITVMAFYHANRASAGGFSPAAGRRGATVVIILFLAVVIIPLWANSDHIDRTTSREAAVGAVAERWTSAVGWTVVGVVAKDDNVFVDVTGPRPEPSLVAFREYLNSAGLGALDVQVSRVPTHYTPVPG
jgi:uncharacterized hydrophobic protein (TIGR00271 family)